jgi:hypothetical protein
LLRPIAACPLPVAQSQARFLWGVTLFRNSNNASGYVGLEEEYYFD